MTSRDTVVNVNLRLRPIRCAFLVDQDDSDALRSVIEVNSCLWGGLFNAVVPVSGRLPRKWQIGSKEFPTVKSVVAGYLDAFEPDYVVVTEASHRLLIPDSTRVVELAEVVGSSSREIGIGMSAANIFSDEFTKRSRFIECNPRLAILPHSDDEMSDFVGALAGALPSSGVLGYVRTYYERVFVPSTQQLTATGYLTALDVQALTPLRAASLGLRTTIRTWRARDPYLFYIDATAPLDLIDYWNLRALGLSITAIPRQWGTSLLPWCRTVTRDRHVPHATNPNYVPTTTLLGGRSLKAGEAEQYAAAIRENGTKGLVYQGWYPRLWDAWARDKDGATRVDVAAKEMKTDVIEHDGRISFTEISPPLPNSAGHPGWANVCTIRPMSGGEEQATLLPRDLQELRRLFDLISMDEPRITSEGIVMFSTYADHSTQLRLPSGVEVFKSWFKTHGYDAELSGAGRIARQLIHRLGGLVGVTAVKHPLVLRTLDDMSHGRIESDVSGDNGSKKVRGRMIRHDDLLGKLTKAYSNTSVRAANSLKHLVKCGALRLGVRIECPICSQANWYPLGDLKENVVCERCLETFAFPANAPPRAPWYYRTQGPFSVENYAQGGYTVALALRFFRLGMSADLTWTPSLEVRRDGEEPFEVDFALWWSPDRFHYVEPALVFGEAKGYGGASGDSFTLRDVRRARALMKRFPGAVHVFATLKDSLNKKEQRMLGQLALRGRRYLKADQWRAPVLILTATELFGDVAPPYCWKGLDGKRGKIAEQWNALAQEDKLHALCDATQQAYLDVPSYWEWWHAQHPHFGGAPPATETK